MPRILLIEDDAAMRLLAVSVVIAFGAVWTSEILLPRRHA